jgi:ubiquinone/menaquinone biosynthesis C-methylase UbiE
MQCPNCGEKRNNNIVGQKHLFNIVECQSCHLVFAFSLTDASPIMDLYESGRIIEDSGTENFNEQGEIIIPAWKDAEQEKILKTIIKYKQNGKLLDIGCLWGIFLKKAAQNNFEVNGIEPMKKAADYAQRYAHAKIFQGTLEEAHYPDESFDAITVLDVLEHMQNPWSSIEKLKRILKTQGLLIICIPNIKGLFPTLRKYYCKLRGISWIPIEPPFHLFGFNSTNFCKMIKNIGFEILQLQYLSEFVTFSAGKPLTIKFLAIKLISKIGELLNWGDRMVLYCRKY